MEVFNPPPEPTAERRTDKDGEPLLSMEDISALTGWTNETIKHYHTAGNRARAEGNETPRDMPERACQVRKRMTKGDGKPLVVWASLWRKDKLAKWFEAREVAVDWSRCSSRPDGV